MHIFLTKRAEKNYRSIQEYLEEEWGKKVLKTFEQKTVDFFDLLEKFPELGSIEEKQRKIRGFQITRHIRVFYRIRQNRIIILSFFDVRQDPNKKHD